RERAERAEQRPGDRELELPPGVLRALLEEDARAQERDEERRGHGQALALGLEPVAALVHEDESDQPDREPDPAEPQVGAERDEQAEQELVLEDRDAELRDDGADRGERGPDLPAELAPVRAAARLDRLVAAKLGLELRPGGELAHPLMVATEEAAAP